jgi:lysine 2,3-aminomutase
MSPWAYESLYSREVLLAEGRRILAGLSDRITVGRARRRLTATINRIVNERLERVPPLPSHAAIRTRDCARALLNVLRKRSRVRDNFSVTQALWDLACGRVRDDLQPGFYAELINWFRGLEGRAPFRYTGDIQMDAKLTGRPAARARSAELDRLWDVVDRRLRRYADGLSAEARARRLERRRRVCEARGAAESDWNDWRWQVGHLITDGETLARLTALDEADREVIARARNGRLPFAVTPYYASLMDDEPGDRDRAIRAQVIPPADYVDWMLKRRNARERSGDFMLESDTSPVELITRRYPAVVILKPFLACPQICVYCQRNWEIEQAMAPGAMASAEDLDAAVRWIGEHPAVREVLVTGGDPLAITDQALRGILERLAKLENVDVIRIGTRTPVTLPMRITEELAAMLGSFRRLGRRDVAVVTHIEHPYEITPETVLAVDRLKRQGLSVYNQQVYTFYTSRRMETARLRLLLRRIGVDPYYTFAPKGKEETNRYRVPIARILQEQKEEARLLPGLRRTDEAVYNVPGLGKNYLRAFQHRDLITLLPDGARLYHFHPWEKNVAECEGFLTPDVPILDYLIRLSEIEEDPADYDSIWFYV